MLYKLKIGSYEVRYTPLKTIVKEYPNCNSQGDLLKKVIEKPSVSYFVDEKGTQYSKDRVFKLINEKPMGKLSKTKEVTNYREVDIREIQDLVIEKEYLVFNELLLRDLKESGKALKFGFTNGNGYKVFLGYIYINDLYPDFLFMALSNCKKSEIINQITELQKEKEKLKSIEISIQGIDKAKVEDLIQI